MRAQTFATLARTADGRSVVAGIIRNARACVLCGHVQDGSAYAICPDCHAANPNAMAHPLVQRALRRAEFEPFPRAWNLAQTYRALRARNRSADALRIAEFVHACRERKPQPLSASERASAERFSRAVAERFAIDDTFQQAYLRIVHEEASGEQADGSPTYAGEGLLERFGIDAESVREFADTDSLDLTQEEHELVLAAASVVRDVIRRDWTTTPAQERWHEQRVAEFFGRAGVESARAPLTRSRPRRIFVGYRHPSGTYSYGMQRREPARGLSSARYAQQVFA